MSTTVINKTVQTTVQTLLTQSHKVQLFEQSDQHLISPDNVNT